MRTSEEDIISSGIDNFVTKIDEININDNTFVNIKFIETTEIYPEWNSYVTEILSSSDTKSQIYNRFIRGYVGVSTAYQQLLEKYTRYDKMKGESINPFGIYLDIDCITNIKEAIDKWEITLRIAVAINKMDIEFGKTFC